MKITINTAQLKAAIMTVIPALAQKSESVYTHAYEFIYIDVKDNLMTLKCCNLSIQIETTLNVYAEGDDTLLVPGKLFADIVKMLPGEDTVIERKKDVVYVVSGAVNMDVSTIQPDEFSGMAVGEPDAAIRIPQNTLKKMIMQTAPFALNDDSKPILKGVYVKLNETMLEMVALDNLKLARRMESIENIGEAKNADVIIPTKLMESAARVLNDNAESVTVTFTKRNFAIRAENITIILTRIDGQYINYMNILPTYCDSRVRLNCKEFCRLMERALVVASSDQRNAVRLVFDGEVLNASVNNEVGRMTDEISIFMSGEPIRIAFNARYLLDVIKGIDDDEIVLELTLRRGPCVIRPVEKNSYYYLVVPVSEV